MESTQIIDENVTTGSGAIVSGDGTYRFEVVGESHYQANLEHIAGGRTPEGAKFQCVAILIPEPNNPHDSNAVYVSVAGRKVAYLSREWAVRFNKVLSDGGYEIAECRAVIVGGWDRGREDRGHFGIKLDIALPVNLQAGAVNYLPRTRSAIRSKAVALAPQLLKMRLTIALVTAAVLFAFFWIVRQGINHDSWEQPKLTSTTSEPRQPLNPEIVIEVPLPRQRPATR